MADDLLPPNATPAERALAGATARITDVPVPVGDLWDPWACPAALLPWLAWALSVDEWDPEWPEATRREVVARSVELHRHKGTVWSVRQALRSAGYAEAEIQEGVAQLRYDDGEVYGGAETYGGGNRWAQFRVVADLGESHSLTAADTRRLVRLIERNKPASRHLRDISYRATVADEADVDDAMATTVEPQAQDLRPAGRRYDGALDHDQAARLLWDGSATFDGTQRFDGWGWTGEAYANDWEAVVAAGALDLGADRARMDARYDGAMAYAGGIEHGADAPPALDGGLSIVATRHRRHDGRHRYGGDDYDGARDYAGAALYFAGIHYAGATQEVWQ